MARRGTTGKTGTGDHPIRVILVEPRTLVGIGVRQVLEDEPGIEIVAEVRSAEEAVPVVVETAPDVVLVDAELSGPEVTGQTRRLHQQAPDAAIVIVGRENDEQSILGAIEVGAKAHVAEAAEPDELVSAIRRAATGEDPLKEQIVHRPDLVERVVDAVRQAYLPPNGHPDIPLTERELDVLRGVANGLRNREIATSLGVSEQTVKNHLTRILHKTGVPNRTHLVTLAVRQGWITLDEVGTTPH